MTDIQGSPTITPEQAHRLVVGLKTMTTYKSSDLYKRYVDQCQQAGRDPVHPVVLGRMLKHIGCDRRKKGTGKNVVSAWLITTTSQREEWADGRWI